MKQRQNYLIVVCIPEFNEEETIGNVVLLAGDESLSNLLGCVSVVFGCLLIKQAPFCETSRGWNI